MSLGKSLTLGKWHKQGALAVERRNASRSEAKIVWAPAAGVYVRGTTSWWDRAGTGPFGDADH